MSKPEDSSDRPPADHGADVEESKVLDAAIVRQLLFDRVFPVVAKVIDEQLAVERQARDRLAKIVEELQQQVVILQLRIDRLSEHSQS
jgi:hypothetical protein